MESASKDVVTSTKMKMNVEIEYYGAGLIRGVLHSQYLEKPYEFMSFIRMINKMEEIFDEKRFPGVFLSPRSFGSVKGGAKKSVLGDRQIMEDFEQSIVQKGAIGSKCTFEIMVRYRQNATWQGQILWIEKNLRQSFRSVLEMLKLMDEALTEGEESSGPVVWEGGNQ